jgi:hypothetical protein
MDQAPVCFARHRVDVLLAQETDVVRFLELLHVAGVVAGLAVEELDGSNIFIAAMNGFDLAVPSQLASHLWSRDAQHQQHQEDEYDDAEEHEALFVTSPCGCAARDVVALIHRRAN